MWAVGNEQEVDGQGWMTGLVILGKHRLWTSGNMEHKMYLEIQNLLNPRLVIYHCGWNNDLLMSGWRTRVEVGQDDDRRWVAGVHVQQVSSREKLRIALPIAQSVRPQKGETEQSICWVQRPPQQYPSLNGHLQETHQVYPGVPHGNPGPRTHTRCCCGALCYTPQGINPLNPHTSSIRRTV